GNGDFGDVADLVGEVAGHRIDVVGQVLPGASHTGHGRLATQLPVRADLAGHSADFGSERVQLVHHGVNGVLQFQNLTLDIHSDLLREVAVGHSDGHTGDIANLGSQVACHLVDTLGQVLPHATDPFDLGLAAQLAVRAHFAGHACHLRREHA